VPKAIAELCNAALAGDFATARKRHFETYDLMRAIFFETNPIPMKYMMKRIGLIPRNEHRLPMMPATPEIEKRLDAVLAKAGLI
jgi:4-hydroxy-tetrahydrodipicolinate synthase